LHYVGVLAVEMFVAPSPRGSAVLVNEIAPRVHNSGHWTLDGASISQFEQHIRAIAGLSLLEPVTAGPARMINLIGDDARTAADWAAKRHASLHLYGKHRIRPGRKMGHVTARRATPIASPPATTRTKNRISPSRWLVIPPPSVCSENQIKAWAQNDRQKCRIYEIGVEQEPGSGGKESAEATIRNLAGFKVYADKVTGSKEVRAEPLAAQVQGGNVWLGGGQWQVALLDEMQSFPAGKHRDQVDACSGAFNRLIAAPTASR
jgi:predicted phage terminase large subunit-like protein